MGEAEEAEVFALICEAEFALQALELDVADEQVGLARTAIGKDGAFNVR
jgi:hypothetical protein